MHIVCSCLSQTSPFPAENVPASVIILVNIAATKISAGVSTGIGEHVDDLETKGDDQFEISDGRSVEEVYEDLLHLNLQPVMNDYVYV